MSSLARRMLDLIETEAAQVVADLAARCKIDPQLLAEKAVQKSVDGGVQIRLPLRLGDKVLKALSELGLHVHSRKTRSELICEAGFRREGKTVVLFLPSGFPGKG